MSAQSERVYLSRSEEVRRSNDHIAARAVQFRFVSRVPMLCECSNPQCQEFVLIQLDRWEELEKQGFLTAPNHRVEQATLEIDENDYWVQRPTASSDPRNSPRREP